MNTCQKCRPIVWNVLHHRVSWPMEQGRKCADRFHYGHAGLSINCLCQQYDDRDGAIPPSPWFIHL